METWGSSVILRAGQMPGSTQVRGPQEGVRWSEWGACGERARAVHKGCATGPARGHLAPVPPERPSVHGPRWHCCVLSAAWFPS